MLAISYLYPYNSIILGVEVKSELNEYTYMIDNRDNICEVSENWNSFAVKNDAPELTAEKVAGESIWNFLKNKDVRHIYHNLIEGIRDKRKQVQFPFRCDSPGLIRFMKMTMSPADHGAVVFRSKIEKVEKRDPIMALECDAKRSSEVVEICSWCKKVKHAGYWLELDRAVKVSQIFKQNMLPLLSHTICDSCLNNLEKE